MVEITDTNVSAPAAPQDVDARGCKTGCAVLGCGCLVLILAVAGLGIYGAMTYRTWGTRLVRDMICAPIEDSDLNEAYKTGFTASIDRAAEAGRSGEVGFEEFLRLLSLRETNPFLAIALIDTARERFIPASGLAPAEREEADRVFRRFCYGALEYEVSDWEVQETLGWLAVTDVPPVRRLRSDLSDAELRDAVALMARMADDAGVRDLPPEIDYVQRFAAYVNELVNGSPAIAVTDDEPAAATDDEAMDGLTDDLVEDAVQPDSLDEPLLPAPERSAGFTCDFEGETAGGTLGDIESTGPGGSACLAALPSRDAQYATEAVVFLPAPLRITDRGSVSFRFRLTEGGRLMMCRLAARTEDGEALEAQYVHIALKQDEWNSFDFDLRKFRRPDGTALPAGFDLEAIHFLGGFKPVELNARLYIDDIAIRE